MNYKIVGIFLLVTVAVFGAWYFTHENSATEQPPKPSAVEQQSQPAPKPSTDSFVEISQISPAMSGMTKETCGIVQILNEGKGNVYVTLKDPNTDSTFKGVMFAKTNTDDPARKEMLLRSRDNNSVVYVKGEVDIYKGELEIKIWQVYEK